MNFIFDNLKCVNGYNVGMIETACCPCLLNEPFESGLIGLGINSQFLNGNGAIQQGIVGQINCAKGTLTQTAYNLVFKKLLIG